MKANIYAVGMLLLIAYAIFNIYKYRLNKITIKRFFISIFFAILFFIFIGSTNLTLCYSNPITLIILSSILVFFSILLIKDKKRIKNVVFIIFVLSFALMQYFRTFTGKEHYTTSMSFIKNMNSMSGRHGENKLYKAIPLWHTTFTNIYKVKIYTNKK